MFTPKFSYSITRKAALPRPQKIFFFSPIDKRSIFCYSIPTRGISAVGSAQHWQCWGQGFESPTLHQIRTQNRIQLFVPILRFLLPFRGIFALSRHKKHIFDKRSPSSERFYTFGGWAFLLALKLRIFVKIIGIRLNYGAIVKT